MRTQRAKLLQNLNRRLYALELSRTQRPKADTPAGLAWLRTFLPHYCSSAPADFHVPISASLEMLHLHRGSKRAIIAPREGAKSTLVTLAYVLRAALERWERYILLLSDSADQATEKLQDIKREIDGNQQLARQYPDACGVGPCWRSDRIELRNGVVIQAIGRKGRIRGRRNRQDRPSLVIFDDVENNATITSPTERDSTWRWATREVIPAGTAETNFISVGSALHRECAAVRLGTLAGWTTAVHPAIHAWPVRMDLWEEWERLATNLVDDARDVTARAFYDEHRFPMDAGSSVYWKERWPLYDLMKRRAEVGAAAFDTEYQGIPSLEGLTEWPASYFDNQDLWFDQWPDDIYLRVQSLDPSKGIADQSHDYQAHVQIGLSRRGDLYVDAAMQKESIHPMIQRSIKMASAFWPLAELVIENNDVLGMLVEEFKQQLAAAGKVMPLNGYVQKVNKETRIRRLGAYFARGRIKFRRTQGMRILVDQLRDFPNGDHDDGPDALELAILALEHLTNPR